MELLYNPEVMSEADIKKTFVARQPLVDDLISLIERQPNGAGVQHVVIIAPRGMGKTTVLLMVKFAIKDRGLAERWQAVKFPEESYGVYDLADFWIEALNLLTIETGDDEPRRQAQELKKKYRNNDDLQEAALAALKDWRRKHDKRLLLLVENLDMILAQINDERDNARLRDALMNDGTIMVIGGATTFFKEARAYNQPLYNFFKIYNLADLRFEQMQELLRRRAELDTISNFEATLKANESRLRALEYFTGGNPRLVLMLYRVVTQSDITEVRRALEKLLDEVTPSYKSKVEALPPQQRKIVDHIARVSAQTNEGLTPTEIAEAVRLSPNQVSAQLKRLSEIGYVRVANLRRRSSYYTLSEPLYAIWHQMRFGRDAYQRMGWLVSFLKVWYAADEFGPESARLEARFRDYLRSNHSREAHDVLEHHRYLAEATENASIRYNAMERIVCGYFDLNETETIKRELLPSIKLEHLSDDMLNRLVEADCISAEQMYIAKATKPLTNITLQEKQFAETMVLAIKAASEKNSEDFLKYIDHALQIKPDDHEAWVSRGNVLGDLGRHEEALASFDRALEIKPDKHTYWVNRGRALRNLSRYEEALASLDRALKINPDDYLVWHNRGAVIFDLGRYEEAIESYKRATEINPKYHHAWCSQMAALNNLGRYEEAMTALNHAKETDPECATTWYCHAFALQGLKDYEAAIASYDCVLEVKPDEYRAWGNRGRALLELGQHEEAVASFDRTLEIKSDDHRPWNWRGNALLELGRDEEALASFDRVLKIKPDEHSAWINKGYVYLKKFNEQVKQGKFNSAEQDWRKALESGEKSENQDWPNVVSETLVAVAQSGQLSFVRRLITESNLEEQVFPLVRAIDYLLSGDEALIEKLSPEVRGIVEEVVSKLRTVAQDPVHPNNS